MSVTTPRCPKCGAQVPRGALTCAYCDAEFASLDGPAGAALATAARRAGGQFGVMGAAPLVVGAVAMAFIDAAGWWLARETRSVWASSAVEVWAVGLPLCLATTALVWRARWGAWIPAIVVPAALLAVHLVVGPAYHQAYPYLTGDDWDFAAIAAGAALGGWVVGRVVREVVRRERARAGLGEPSRRAGPGA